MQPSRSVCTLRWLNESVAGSLSVVASESPRNKLQASSPDEGDGGWITCFRNCLSLRRGRLTPEDVWVRDGRVLDALRVFYEERRRPDDFVDCGGRILAPAFIDVQVNGGLGRDFSAGDLDGGGAAAGDDFLGAVDAVARDLVRRGVTAFCPTLISCGPDTYQTVMAAGASRGVKTAGSTEAAAVLGLHLEGPFISAGKSGMHPRRRTRQDCGDGFPEICRVYGTTDFSQVAMVTLAPELPGALDAVCGLRARGVRVSLGHSDASLEAGEAAVRAGASMITHLFSAMGPFHHRQPHLPGLLVSEEVGSAPVYYGLIADCEHTHPAALRLAWRSSFPGLVLVSDACPARGLPDGRYTFGDADVAVSGGLCRLSGTDVLAGSMATLDVCVRRMHEAGVCPPERTLEAASLHPADMLGLADRGRIEPGALADLVLLDSELRLLRTFVRGRPVQA